MLTISSAAVTHTGRVRESNEDSMLVTDRFVAVADGLGGHAAGEVASSIAVERLRLLDDCEIVHPDDVISAIEDANRQILAETKRRTEYDGMGTTLTGLGMVDVGGSEHYVVFNVGDSRVYRYTEGVLWQVTVDHSEVEELRASGQLSAEDAARYPRRNVVTRCLGSDPAPTPDLWVFPPSRSERFLVCSDGLTNEVDDAGIAELLGRHDEPEAAAGALLEEALAAGGRDNVAVIVVDLTSMDTQVMNIDTAPRSKHLTMLE
ncbi:MAG: PP2C family protein-serine/threonine phosphatase [Jatrophihabitans sp.]